MTQYEEALYAAWHKRMERSMFPSEEVSSVAIRFGVEEETVWSAIRIAAKEQVERNRTHGNGGGRKAK